MSFKELIERLEKATGPDRELADEVLFACGWQANYDREAIEEIRRDGWKCESEGGEEYTDTFAEFMNFACWYPPANKPFRDAWIHGHGRPDPTASLDAALALVPEGWQWSANGSNGLPVSPSACLQRGDPPYYDNEEIYAGDVATTIIAVCIAALKARAVQP